MTRVTDEQIADMKALGGERARLLERKLERAIHHLEAERARAMEDDFRHINKLAEAQKWAAWFAAERDWHLRRFEAQVAITEGIAKMYGAQMRRADAFEELANHMRASQ